MYQVASMSISYNGWITWKPLGEFRKKADAIALAEAQPIRTAVNKNWTSAVVYDNGKAHGGERVFDERCSCPRCQS